MPYCRICGDEAGVEFRPSARQSLCKSCAQDTPEKVSRSEFEAAYWVDVDGKPVAEETPAAIRREFYNDSVNVNNVRVEQFPDTVVARLFGFRQFPLLRFAAEEKKDVDLKQLFNS